MRERSNEVKVQKKSLASPNIEVLGAIGGGAIMLSTRSIVPFDSEPGAFCWRDLADEADRAAVRAD